MARRPLAPKVGDAAAVWFDLHKLKGWQNNPKNHSKKQIQAIKASLKEFGWGRPMVARKVDQEITAGHGTVIAALELYDEGFSNEKVKDFSIGPVRFVELDAKHAHGYAVADNKTAEMSTWDKEKLPLVMSDFRATPSILEATGFKFKDVFGSEASASADDNDPQIEEPKEPITKVGDVWELGDHLLVCGDNLSPTIREKVHKGKPIDCVVTDPPFAIYGSSSGIGPDIADDKMVRPFFEQMWRNIKSIVKPFGHVYVCCDWRSYAAVWDTCSIAEMSPKNCIIWDKMNSGLGSSYSNAYEMIFFAARLPPGTTLDSTHERGQRMVHHSNIVRYSRVQGAERLDTAAKPIEMFKLFVENSTEEGETVLDLYGGSGTIIIACELAKRKARVVEIKAAKCDLQVARWERRTGQKAKRIPAKG